MTVRIVSSLAAVRSKFNCVFLSWSFSFSRLHAVNIYIYYAPSHCLYYFKQFIYKLCTSFCVLHEKHIPLMSFYCWFIPSSEYFPKAKSVWHSSQSFTEYAEDYYTLFKWDWKIVFATINSVLLRKWFIHYSIFKAFFPPVIGPFIRK